MLDLKTLIARSANDAELNWVRYAIKRAEKNTAENNIDPYSRNSQKVGPNTQRCEIYCPNRTEKKFNRNIAIRPR